MNCTAWSDCDRLWYVWYVCAFSYVVWVLSVVRQQPVCHRSFLCVSAVATAVLNAVRSAASKRTPQSYDHNTSSLLILINLGQTWTANKISLYSADQQKHYSHWKKSLWYNRCVFDVDKKGFRSTKQYYQSGILNQCHHQCIQQPLSLLYSVIWVWKYILSPGNTSFTKVMFNSILPSHLCIYNHQNKTQMNLTVLCGQFSTRQTIKADMQQCMAHFLIMHGLLIAHLLLGRPQA